MSHTPGNDIVLLSGSSSGPASGSSTPPSRGEASANLAGALVSTTALSWVGYLMLHGRIDPLHGLLSLVAIAMPTHLGQLTAVARKLLAR